jgi:hypothetical protein
MKFPLIQLPSGLYLNLDRVLCVRTGEQDGATVAYVSGDADRLTIRGEDVAALDHELRLRLPHEDQFIEAFWRVPS